MSKKKRIISTRPLLQNGDWCKLIERHGLSSASWPLLDIRPVAGCEAQLAKQRIAALAEYDAVIFVSQNAVHHGFLLIESYWPQLPVSLSYLAVGKVTAGHVTDHLQRLGDASPVIYASGSMDSEALLALPQLQDVATKKILICRGVGGRPTIASALTQRGARVDLAELYTRQLPAEARATAKALQLNPATDILTFFSGETMDNAVALLKESGLPNWQSIPAVVPGQRVAALAEDAGFTAVIAAKNASTDCMWQSLRDALMSEIQ